MDLLDWARGPLLAAAIVVFLGGTSWRLGRILSLPRQPEASPPRAGAPSPLAGAWGAIWRGMWPRRDFGQTAAITTFNGYVFHIGLALVALGYAPHIAFVRRLVGFGWPALPDGVMYLASGATILSLLLALWLRITDAVRAQISSADDLISWTVTFLPFVTGMAVLAEPSQQLMAQATVYRTPLAIHLLSLELLLVWFPFGKLMHAVLFVFSRGATGMRFSHRGVQA